MTGDKAGRARRLVLASGSPRRRQLLEEAGFGLVVLPADVDERRQEGESPTELVGRLARLKLRACVGAHPGAVAGRAVVAADTIVWTPEGLVMGKPADEGDARRMLAELSGRESRVSTGVALALCDQAGAAVAQASFVETTRVLFWDLSEEEVDSYVASGEPMDKAGAYGIQGLGRLLVRGIDGDYFNVVGLPVSRVVRELGALEARAAGEGAWNAGDATDGEEALVSWALEGGAR